MMSASTNTANNAVPNDPDDDDQKTANQQIANNAINIIANPSRNSDDQLENVLLETPTTIMTTTPPPQHLESAPQSCAKNAIWQRFGDWLHCVCVVTFDLELGQAMELVYPAHARLSEAERTNVCYLAFPDSNSGCMGDTQFHVRLRVQPERPADGRLSATHRRYNERCEARVRADEGHLWGFVYFRQIRDVRRPRGYFQKSLVLLTRLPFVQLFHELCAVVAPLYFDEACADPVDPSPSAAATSIPAGHNDGIPATDSGLAVLEAACAQIGTWPALVAGRQLTLHLLGTIWQTEIPARSVTHGSANKPAAGNNNLGSGGGGGAEAGDARDDTTSTQSISSQIANHPLHHSHDRSMEPDQSNNHPQTPHRVCSVQDVDIYQSLGGMLSHVHLLWELVLTGEPIVVMAASPTDCSHMVQSLTSLIAPLSYSAESRPYFTIHDSEFREFTQRQLGPPPIILGVTNPFFSKTLKHWPHTIRLAAMPGSSSADGPEAGSGPSTASAALSAVTQKLRKMKQQQTTVNSSNGSGATPRSSASGSLHSNGGNGGSRLLDQPPGLYTAYRAFLSKDAGGVAARSLKQIQAGRRTQRPLAAQSALLRKHLLQLTQSFMIPLERYMASLMPLQRDIQPFRAPPSLGCFRPDEFLNTLASGGPQLTSSLRGDWPGLYKRFFRSANFKGWYDRRSAELQSALGVLQMEALAMADLTVWLRGRHEVEIVDMVLKLKQKLRLSAAPQNRLRRATSDSSGDDDGDFDVAPDNCNDTVDDRSNESVGDVVFATDAIAAIEENDHIYDPHALTRRRLREHLQQVCSHLPDDLRHLLKVNNNSQHADGARADRQQSAKEPPQHSERKAKCDV